VNGEERRTAIVVQMAWTGRFETSLMLQLMS
jgi:hypothetical protein